MVGIELGIGLAPRPENLFALDASVLVLVELVLRADHRGVAVDRLHLALCVDSAGAGRAVHLRVPIGLERFSLATHCDHF